MKTAIILYEPKQLASLDVLMQKWSEGGNTLVVVSLDAEIDYALLRRGTPFISGKTLQDRATPSAYLRADAITRELCENETLASLTYRNVSLIKPLRLSLHQYFQNVLYYVDVIERFVEGIPDVGRLIVPASTMQVSKTSGPLGIEETRFVIEAACRVAEERGVLFEEHASLSTTRRFRNEIRELSFLIRRMFFEIALSSLNALVALRPRRPLRVLASDYWRNMDPLLRELPEAEIVLLDRSEALRAGFLNIWRHKMRFTHISHFLSRKGKQRALAHAKKCKEEWAQVRTNAFISSDLVFRGVHLRATAEKIVTHLIEMAMPDVMCDIEGVYAMYGCLSPDVVLLRASVSGQRHFAILPLVAREVDIPALEVQHGGEYLGRGSPTQQHSAYFFAAYGRLVCDELRSLGYEDERLLPVGSPRFDAYMKTRKKRVPPEKTRVMILSNTPSGNIGERYGTYSVEEYFHALGEAVRTVLNSQLVIASRSSSVRGNFLKEARERGLHGVPYESVGAAPLPELFAKADIFVCSHSTVVYEALLYRLPVVMASFAPVEKMMTDFHFSRFREAGALTIAHTPEELREIVGRLATDAGAREQMGAAAEAFMQEQFSFDGHASERIATQVRTWAGVTRAKS